MQCAALDVSRSGLYGSRSRPSHLTIEVEAITVVARVKAIASNTRDGYGTRRMAKALQDEGCTVGRAQAKRLMQDAEVRVKRTTRRGPVTTESRHG